MALEEFNHFFQEASHKTKVTRDKNKIKDDLKYDKSSGFGKIHEPTSNISVPIDISFDNKRPTSAGNMSYKNGKYSVGMNINPNDLSRGHGFTKYLHEKNHILQDLRKRGTDKDTDDLSFISTFLDKHSNEIKNSHSSDKDEYLADLNVARVRGYDKTIRMLQDMMIKNTHNSPAAKNSKSFINKSSNRKIDMNISDEFLNTVYRNYLQLFNNEKEKLNVMRASRNVGDHHIKYLEKRIKKMESDLVSKEHFMKIAHQKLFLQELNKEIDEYNSDLKLRILFLREMKKIDSTNDGIRYKKQFSESADPLLMLLNDVNNEAYDNTEELQIKIDDFITEHFNDNGVIIENIDYVNKTILSYVILEYVENIINRGDE